MRSRIPVSKSKMKDYQTIERPDKKQIPPKSRRNRKFLIVLGMMFLWIVVLVTLLTVLVGKPPPAPDFADEKFLEISKCPACYGVCLCPAFLTRQVTQDSWSRYSPAELLGARNIFLAKFKKKQIILKKLGHNQELNHLDHHILHHASMLNISSSLQDEPSVIAHAIRHYTHHHIHNVQEHDLQGNSTYLVQHLRVFSRPQQQKANDTASDVGSDMLLCPSQRKFSYIEDRFVKDSAGVYRLTALYNLMTVLLVNSEPLIFQSFPASDGWPFPEYLGACGRVVAEEHAGPSLAEWLPRADWRRRMNAALQLLKIARQLTAGVNEFRLYVTDLSIYNVAVNSNETVKIIDGENIVMVDLDQIRKDRPQDYDVPYASDNAGCQEDESLRSDPNCSSYSQEDLCNRLENDHNYFAVCRELYGDYDHFGLVNGLPKKVVTSFPRLVEAQTECFSSTVPGARQKAADDLISIYSRILSVDPHHNKSTFSL